MASSFVRWYRAMRFGRPIVVVSGLPRSGTSMAMRMLEAGGLEVVSDGLRVADDSNPTGYYEDERVKELDKSADTSWLNEARGKAIKVISFLLRDLPDTNNYRVIFMHRPMGEVMMSQNAMLRARNERVDATTDDRLARQYEDHLRAVSALLARRPCFDVLEVNYGDVVGRPLEQAERMARFVGGPLDASKMAAAVDRALYRNRG